MISGNIGESPAGEALSLDGPGELILSGTNSYTGGTAVNAGTMYATNNALPFDRGLTVGAGGTLILDTTPPTPTPNFAASPAGTVAAVPEPSTLGLLLALWSAVACYRFSKRPLSRRTNPRAL